MISKPLLYLLAAVLADPAAFAEKPMSESDLLKQIESLTPASAAAAAAAKGKPSQNSGPTPLFDPNVPLDQKSDLKSGGEKKSKASEEKKAKGPTEITALEATFDQKANLAIFIGNVVVKDPEFNVVCDKLTAHLRHEEKPAAPTGTPGKTTPKPSTPKPDDAAAKKKAGGLEKALAETTSERRVTITQDKKEADGTVTHSIGNADKATYDAVSGDIVLTGTPDVTQGINRVIATSPETVMTLNRDGHMKAVGPHKTIIVDKGDVLQ